MRILRLVLATLSSLRAGQMSETVVKWRFLPRVAPGFLRLIHTFLRAPL